MFPDILIKLHYYVQFPDVFLHFDGKCVNVLNFGLETNHFLGACLIIIKTSGIPKEKIYTRLTQLHNSYVEFCLFWSAFWALIFLTLFREKVTRVVILLDFLRNICEFDKIYLYFICTRCQAQTSGRPSE